MSSDADFIVTLQQVQTDLYKCGGPILISFGMLGNIISMIVFTKKTLRKNPCSIYFVALNTVNLFLIFTSLLSIVLINGYNVDPSSSNVMVCRFRFYAIVLFDVLSPSYLIFASIDRVLLTSPNALTRRRSTPQLAYKCITTITLFWLICHSHVFVLTGIIELVPGYLICFLQPGAYLTVISYYSLIIKGILVPLLMLAFGLWTVKNVQNVGHVGPIHGLSATGPTATAALRRNRSKDSQLIRILLLDISVYVTFSFMISIILMYQQITQYQSKSIAQTRLENFLLNTATFIGYIPFCSGCYTNSLVSRTFRTEVKNLLTCK